MSELRDIRYFAERMLAAINVGNAEEQEKFHNCCESIRENFKIADSM